MHSPWKLLLGFLRTSAVTILFHLNACFNLFLPDGKSYHMQHLVTITSLIMIHSVWWYLYVRISQKNLGLRSRFSDQLGIIADKRCWGLNEKSGVFWSSTCSASRLADFNNLVSEQPILVMIYYCADVGCGTSVLRMKPRVFTFLVRWKLSPCSMKEMSAIKIKVRGTNGCQSSNPELTLGQQQ